MLLLCVIQWKIVVLAVVVYKTQDVINGAVVCDSVEDTGACNPVLCSAVPGNDLVWSVLHTVCQVRRLLLPALTSHSHTT